MNQTFNQFKKKIFQKHSKSENVGIEDTFDGGPKGKRKVDRMDGLFL